VSYALDDFKYSIKGGYYGGESLPSPPVKVHYAYGQVDTDGQCCSDCGGEWSGGFVVELADGQFAHVTGWCDYTGWGCQDGASFTLHATLGEIEPKPYWDKEPADLNDNLAAVLKELAGEEA